MPILRLEDIEGQMERGRRREKEGERGRKRERGGERVGRMRERVASEKGSYLCIKGRVYGR